MQEVRLRRSRERRLRRAAVAARTRDIFEQKKPRQARVREVRLPDGTWSSDRKVWITHLRSIAQDKYADKNLPSPDDREEVLRQLREEAKVENYPPREVCPAFSDVLAARGALTPGKAPGGDSTLVNEVLKALPLAAVYHFHAYFVAIAKVAVSVPVSWQ